MRASSVGIRGQRAAARQATRLSGRRVSRAWGVAPQLRDFLGEVVVLGRGAGARPGSAVGVGWLALQCMDLHPLRNAEG